MIVNSYPSNIAPIDKKVVRRNMNYIRVKRNLTQEALAKAVGVSRSAVETMETDCPPRVPFALVMAVAKALDCDPLWLMGFDDSIPEDAVLVKLTLKSGDEIEALVEKDTYERLGGYDHEDHAKRRHATYKNAR